MTDPNLLFFQDCDPVEEDPIEDFVATMARLSIGRRCLPVRAVCMMDPQNTLYTTLSCPPGAIGGMFTYVQMKQQRPLWDVSSQEDMGCSR